MAAVIPGCIKALVNARWTIVLLSSTNGPRKHSFCLVGAPFLTVFTRWSEGPKILSASGCGQSHELLTDMLKELWVKCAGLTHSRSGNTGERCD